MKRVSLLAATLIFAVLTAASAQDFVMGITFDAGGKFDASFNEGTWRGMTRAIDELSDQYEIELLEFEGTPDTTADGQRRMGMQGAELIVAPGFLQTDAINAVSAEFPNTNFVLIDDVAEDRANVRSVLFKDQEGSYLVGYLAGLLSQTGVVGFVGGMDVPLIRNFNQGYELGVKAACEECTVISNYVGVTPTAWNDPARAKELAGLQQAQGADIIYAAAGASGNGVIDFVNETRCYRPQGQLRETALAETIAALPKDPAYEARCGEGMEPLFFIGVDSNQNYLGDTDNDPSTMNHGLTSMLKRVDVAAYNAVYDTVNGTFEPGLQELGVAEEGVDYAVDEYNEALLPESAIEAVTAISQQITDGSVVVPDYREQ